MYIVNLDIIKRYKSVYILLKLFGYTGRRDIDIMNYVH